MNFFLLYIMALASACAAALVVLPLWRRYCLRHGLVDDPGHRKIHAQAVPLAGGLAVATAVLVPILGAIAFFQTLHLPLPDAETAELLAHGLSQRWAQLSVILLGALGMLLVGLLDDRHELKARTKFAGQLIVALAVAAAGIRVTLFVPSVVFSYFITVLWILTVINAFNFVDNMNGLCAGLGAIGALFFTIISASGGQYLVALIASVTCGALIGFLPYNFPQARAFLGDSGSHLTGYLLAILAILPHFHTPEAPRAWAVITPLLVLAVPLADLAWVVILRTSRRKPFYIGDTNHLSHRLVQLGLSRTGAVLVLWLAALALGAMAFV